MKPPVQRHAAKKWLLQAGFRHVLILVLWHQDTTNPGLLTTEIYSLCLWRPEVHKGVGRLRPLQRP